MIIRRFTIRDNRSRRLYCFRESFAYSRPANEKAANAQRRGRPDFSDCGSF
jgi:hypothetical protein